MLSAGARRASPGCSPTCRRRNPSAGGATLTAMWIAHVICSGPECTEELELVLESLDELERINCECGYGLSVLSISEAELVETKIAEVVSISRRRASEAGDERAAA